MPYRKIRISETTGQKIIQAVKELAIEAVIRPYHIGTKEMPAIGQKSNSLSEHLIIYSDGKLQIDANAYYRNLMVAEYNWGGKIDVPYTREGAERAVRNFAKRLKTKLAAKKKAWPPFHEIAIKLLREDPENNLYTLAKIFSEKTKIPPGEAKALIAAFNWAYDHKIGASLPLYHLVKEAKANLKRQARHKS